MEISDFCLSRLRNEEHFQYNTDFTGLVVNATPVVLGIANQFSLYIPIYTSEGNALNVVQKSDVTNELVDCDAIRDTTFRGLSDSVKSACNHFNLGTKQAAIRIQLVFDEFGNVATKSYDEETAAINVLVSRLNQDYASDVATLGIADWLNELLSNNEIFDALMKRRYSQDVIKAQFHMKQVRFELDAAYRTITKRINALIIVNGEADYKVFVEELNQRIERYKDNLAIRAGKNAADDTTK